MDSTDNRKKAVIEALEKCNGIVSVACRSVDMARSTFYQWMAEDSDFKKSVDEIQEVAIDYVESKLFEKIEGVSASRRSDIDGEPIVYEIPPSDTAIIFYLKTKANKRGYVERQEVDHSGSIDTRPIQYAPQSGNEPIKD